MKAIIFPNGFRKRFVEETGGLDRLDSLFDVFIDTSIYMKPWEYCREYDDVIDHKKKYLINNDKELVRLIKVENIDYLLFVGLEWSKNRYCTLKHINDTGIDWGILFIRGDQKGLFNGGRYDPDRLKKISKQEIFKDFIVKIRNKIRYTGITPKHYISNEINAFGFPEVKRSTNKILVNHKDYYLSRSFEKPITESYIVFLDQAYPFHFCKGHGIEGRVEYYDDKLRLKYYKDLNDYLLLLRSISEKKIVICLHPNCPEEYRKYYSNTFRVVKYETGRYAKYADYLVTHSSTSISMGYIYDVKSIMLILNNTIPSSFKKRIREKARVEGITLHEWPNGCINLEDVTVPRNRLVKEFYVPNPSSVDLIKELEKVLNT